MIGEILGALNIIEKAGRFIGWIRKNQKPSADTVSSRFIQLFESHDVHRNQIPRFFGHGITLKDIQDEAALLGKLDEPLLDAACTLFGVRREWLEGAESQVYPLHDFYKHPEDVAPFLKALKKNNPDGGLDGLLIAPTDKRDDALTILSEAIGGVGEKPIYRYHLCNNWLFDYWKSRAYLTAFIAIAWKHGVHIRGRYMPLKEIKRIVEGESLLISEDGSTLDRCGKLWYPEDMAIKPEDYLSGVDRELNGFGVESALQLWLNLEENGYMDTGLSMYPRENIRASFEQALGNVRH
jgi:hypothetical protein